MGREVHHSPGRSVAGGMGHSLRHSLRPVHTAVLAFRPATGHYAFRERGLATATHAHPSLEVIRAEDGAFALRQGTGAQGRSTAAVVAPNVPHAFGGTGGACRIDLFDLELLLPGACEAEARAGLLDAVADVREGLAPKQVARLTEVVAAYVGGDALVGQAARRLRDAPADVTVSVAVLANAAYLSESQFIRRFTAAMGLPPRAFLVYRRLRAAVALQATTGSSLTEAVAQQRRPCPISSSGGLHRPGALQSPIRGVFWRKPLLDLPCGLGTSRRVGTGCTFAPMIRAATPTDRSAILEVAVDSGLFPAEHVGELGVMMDDQLGQEAEGHH